MVQDQTLSHIRSHTVNMPLFTVISSYLVMSVVSDVGFFLHQYVKAAFTVKMYVPALKKGQRVEKRQTPALIRPFVFSIISQFL